MSIKNKENFVEMIQENYKKFNMLFIIQKL
jgi:uncharacterized protein YfkK (UPF0435 family)